MESLAVHGRSRFFFTPHLETFFTQPSRASHGILQAALQMESVVRNGSSSNEVPAHSLARTDYANEAEVAVNEQVKSSSLSWLHHGLGV